MVSPGPPDHRRLPKKPGEGRSHGGERLLGGRAPSLSWVRLLIITHTPGQMLPERTQSLAEVLPVPRGRSVPPEEVAKGLCEPR